ncbi:ferredoxin Fer [Halegenticoccus soli]|uniref:ferredoxin Fer n=1 Tax=Halegenticoccus soli TaxID=1985678 RepID=UPI000C6E6325|nr:ferredoxin Fer [Halegenticoccus soli]
MDSPFDVLGIDSDADDAEIKQAYRQRVKQAHPDHGGSQKEFRLVRAAYEEIRTGDRNGKYADDPESVEEQRRREGLQVEYVNYEVLEEYGWDLDDEDLFEKASAAGLDPADHGRILVRPRESLLEAAENRGFAWPYACRGGACANCAVAVVEGEAETYIDNVLPPEMIERGVRLSCISAPITENMKVVYNVKNMPYLDELRLPPDRFDRAYPTD